MERFAIPAVVTKAISDMGYMRDSSMDTRISEWWSWYTAEAGWYHVEERREGRGYKLDRHTLHPARRVCREWASAILDDDGTRLVPSDPDAADLLDGWVSETRFLPNAQRCLERAFATGTGAMALWFDVRSDDSVAIRARRYDARMVVPLTWDDDGVTECAFCTQAHYDGRPVWQLQMHVLDSGTGTYHVVTKLFGMDDKAVEPGEVLADYDTESRVPTFAVIRPALDNAYCDGTAYGQSVFADAIDAIKGVDNAFDSMQREIDATKVKVFMTDDLLDVVDDGDGRRFLPMSPDNTYVRKLSGNGSQQMLEVFSPEIRMDPLVRALNVSLAELGDLTGLGANYLRFDKDGGMKTAREVSSDNSALARTIRKHENELRPQLEGLLACLVDCQRRLNAWDVEEGCSVTVEFDDSIVSDTDSAKAVAMSEVAAGVLGAWEYRVRFYGEDEQTARDRAAELAMSPVPGTMA